MPRYIRIRAAALVAAALATLALLLTHRPSAGHASAQDPTALVVLAAAWVAWALTGYLLTGIGVAAAAHLRARPSAVGHLPRLLAPLAVRRLVATALGASATAAVVCLGPAAAWADAPRPPAPAATASPLDWPGLVPSAPTHDPAVRLVSAPQRRHAAGRAELVVHPGDSLWSLTARRLGPGTPAAAIAAEWPRLYAANRAAIGPDPNLIRPGQRLVPPAPDERTSR